MGLPASDRQSILICDDSIDEIRVIVSVLKMAEYKLIIARDGRQACDRAGLLQPDLILLDVRMPGMDGFATCRLLKAHQDTRNIPIIFLTAANDLTDRIQGLRAGAIDYIVKPANEEEVLLRVSAQLARNKSFSGSKSEVASNSPHVHHSHQALVSAVVNLLNEESDDEIDLDEIASKLGCGRGNLNDAFRAALDVSFFGWLREQRLKRAFHWLARTELPINQIAQELGYTSSANFATAFRERHGVTPREFRKRATVEPRWCESLLTPSPHDLSLTSNPWNILERGIPSSQG